MRPASVSGNVTGDALDSYRSFSLSRNKKINWKPSSVRSQENEML